MGFIIKNDDEWKPEESKYNQPKKTETEPEKKDAKEDPKWPKWLRCAKVVNCGSLNMRSEPRGDIVGTVAYGTTLCVWDETYEWSCVSVINGSRFDADGITIDDARSWVKREYLETIEV